MNRLAYMSITGGLVFAATLFQAIDQESATEHLAFKSVTGSPFHVGPMAGRPAIGDCNGDGHLDIVVACGTC